MLLVTKILFIKNFKSLSFKFVIKAYANYANYANCTSNNKKEKVTKKEINNTNYYFYK